MELFDLSNKVAIVTGGNGGIGLGMARGLAKAGAAVVIAARNRDKAEGAVKELTQLGAKTIFVPVDVAKDKSCQDLITSTVEHFGRLDILVNNAGIALTNMPEDFPLEDWRKVIDTNLTSAFLCSQAAYPQMKKVGRGKIINVASGLAFFATPQSAAYSASKAGVLQMGRSLAMAWGKDNIQVNTVVPGWTVTDMTRGRSYSVPALKERITARIPLGRWGEPDDFAGIAVFLASAASDFITGGYFVVDGGYLISG
jgi:2-dehydro-3-deoxy-D-gluconate 5-dehydrogenase